MCKLSLIFVPLLQHWSREADSTRHWIFFGGWQRTPSLRAGPVTMSWITWPYNAIHRFSDASYYKWLLAKSCLDAANKIAEGWHIANTHNIYQWFLSMKNDEICYETLKVHTCHVSWMGFSMNLWWCLDGKIAVYDVSYVDMHECLYGKICMKWMHFHGQETSNNTMVLNSTSLILFSWHNKLVV